MIWAPEIILWAVIDAVKVIDIARDGTSCVDMAQNYYTHASNANVLRLSPGLMRVDKHRLDVVGMRVRGSV